MISTEICFVASYLLISLLIYTAYIDHMKKDMEMRPYYAKSKWDNGSISRRLELAAFCLIPLFRIMGLLEVFDTWADYREFKRTGEAPIHHPGFPGS